MRGQMRVHITNCLMARQFVPTEPTLAIRILDPAYKDGCHVVCGPDVDVPIKPNPLWLGELRYRFADIDPVRKALEGNYDEAKEILENPECFTLEQAKKIREEAEPLLFQAQTLLVHCWAGISRSPAVARALCDAFGYNINWTSDDGRHGLFQMGWLGNFWVYRLVRTGKEIDLGLRG